MFICLDSKYSLKHVGHCQLFLLLYSPDKINLCVRPVLDTISWEVALFFPETNIREAGILKREREIFFLSLSSLQSPN